MDTQQLQAWRVQRLQALAEKVGGKTALGRKLGYQNGAFVSQMIQGHRPISEKTIFAIHQLPGCRGWFDSATDTHPAMMGASSTLLAQSLEIIVAALRQADDLTRDQAAPLLAHLVKTPERAPEIVPRLSALLDRPPPSP